MKKIVAFGNCQAGQIASLLEVMLPRTGYKINSYSNNARTGEQKSVHEVMAAIKQADVLIYQPLSENHGKLSESGLLSRVKDDCAAISFSYLYNSGITALGQAPKGGKRSYGLIFGEDVLRERLAAGAGRADLKLAYEAGTLDFKVRERFAASLAEMKRRETRTSIRLGDFIQRHYQATQLFLTHSHPTNAVFFELLRQLTVLTDLPIDLEGTQPDALPSLFQTNYPLSPHDVREHGYQFAPHADWLAKGHQLIDLVVDEWETEQQAEAQPA